MLRTKLTDLLGIEHPIVLGGMGSGTNVELVSAVSQAGGLGILGASGRSPEQMYEAADAIRARTARPFGLNLLLFMVGSRIDPRAVEAAIGSGARVLSTAWGDPAPY